MGWDFDLRRVRVLPTARLTPVGRMRCAGAALAMVLTCAWAQARIILPQAAASPMASAVPSGGVWSASPASGPSLALVTASQPRIAPELHAHIVRSAAMWQLDPDLVKAVIHAESAFRPRAVSPKNAIGLMQVLPATARQMGLLPRGGMSVTELLMNDQVSILVGTKYLAQQLQRFGQVDLALAAYNAGPEAVVRAGQRVPAYAETQAYVRRVLSLYAQHRRAAAWRGGGA